MVRCVNEYYVPETGIVGGGGCWLLVVGCWLLVVGWLLLVGGCWLVVDDDEDNNGSYGSVGERFF